MGITRHSSTFFWLIALFFWAKIPVFAQKTEFPFQLEIDRDLQIGIGGIGLNLTGYAMRFRTNPLTPGELLTANRQDIRFGFDRNVVDFRSHSAGRISDVLVVGGMLGGGALNLSTTSTKNWFCLGVMAAETVLWTTGFSETTKALVLRSRPYTYNPLVPLSEKINPDARRSFFSQHAATSAAVCVFSAEIFAATHPQSRWKPWVRAGAYVLPVAVSLLRVRAGEHFPTDVLAGCAVGAAVGWAVPHLHRKRSKLTKY